MSVAHAKRLAVESRSIAGTNGNHLGNGNGLVKRSMQRPSSTSKRSGPSPTVKAIERWLSRDGKGWLDALAASPQRFLEMGLDVALQTDLVGSEEHARAAVDLETLIANHSEAITAAARVCRTAMNARKGGQLPAPSSMPGAKAAATRRRKAAR